MAQSLAKNLIHLVFSTKNRERTINDDLQSELHAFIAGIFKELGSPAIRIGGTRDHVHALFILSKSRALTEVVQEVKRSSSKWMKPHAKNFYWQSGYGAFSVGESAVQPLCMYIEKQNEHHRTVNFEEEFRKLCAQYNVELNEKYAWD